jgi:ABC-type multidrug transport system ATPase subunit
VILMKLEIVNLTKKYNQTMALDNVSVTLTEGIYGILGPNGAGKSTLMNILTDNLTYDAGKILYDGQDVFKMGEAYRELVGYMPQEQIGYPQFSVMEFMCYMALLKGLNVKKNETKEQINNILSDVNLYDVRKKKAGCLSGR